MVLFNLDDDRTWKGLLVLGLLLNLMVCFTSELGLDTHVKMAVDENGGLPWGDLRPDSAGFSDPTDVGERSVLPIYQASEGVIKATALMIFVGLIAYVHRTVGLRSAAVLSLSPALIFSIGRGYEEVHMALAFGLAFGLFTQLWSKQQPLAQNLLGGLLLMFIPFSKGMAEPSHVLGGAVLLGTCGMLWHIGQTSERERLQWLKHPLRAATVSTSAVFAFILVVGITRSSPTLGVMVDEPLRYASAVALAVLDVVLIFTLFGMVLWPLVRPTLQRLGAVEDAQLSTMLAMIAAAMTALVLYVAALWTYESVLWDAPWPGVVFTMGNNGRYVTLLFLPLVVFLNQMHMAHDAPTIDAPGLHVRAVSMTLLLLIPISLLAGLHGQTMWTDEAADAMPIEQDEHFLFVSDATLGMHWLYTFYEPLDAEANNITGHWRSTDVNWVDDLQQNLPQVTVIVLSPDVGNVPTGWVVESTGEADLLNGGGEWRVLTRT